LHDAYLFFKKKNIKSRSSLIFTDKNCGNLFGALQNFLAESAGNVGARILEKAAQTLYRAVDHARDSEMSRVEMFSFVHQVNC
jgi:hypothetical protein